MNFRHVPADHHMGQAARAAQRGNVLIRRFGMPLVAEGKRAVEEMFAGARRDLDQLSDGEFSESRLGLADLAKIFPENSGIDHGNVGMELTGAMIFELESIEALVGASEPECREMRQ